MSILKDTCSASELAELLQITPRHVRGLANSSVLIKESRGLYRVQESLNGYLQYLSDQIPNRTSSKDVEVTSDIKVEQCKLVSEKARIAKMERQEMEGTLLKAPAVKRDAYMAAANTRQAMMLIPDSMAPLLAEMSEAREIRTAMRASITQGLTDASELIAASAQTDPDDEDSLVKLTDGDVL